MKQISFDELLVYKDGIVVLHEYNNKYMYIEVNMMYLGSMISITTDYDSVDDCKNNLINDNNLRILEGYCYKSILNI
jgi:hypothetical protein